LAAFGFVFILLSDSKRIKTSRLKIGGLCLLLGIPLFALGIHLQRASKINLHDEISSFIKDNEKNITVFINDSLINDDHRMLMNLRSLRVDEYHHSHPTKGFTVRLESNVDTLYFRLRQDSQLNEEFWVYQDSYNKESESEIGKIKSKLFLEYLLELNIQELRYKD